MKIKEQSMIDAVDRLGPSWSPTHPFFAGIWLTLLLAFFGAVLMLFQIGGRGADDPAELYAAATIGVLFSFGLALLSLLFVAVQSLRFPDERSNFAWFALGTIGSISVLAVAIFLFADELIGLFDVLPERWK